MWKTGLLNGYWWQAKVYKVGSLFGIAGGRVSKLAICEGDSWNSKACVYNYDRGLDFDNCPPEILNGVLALFP